ncbi:type I-E CRISPR-associated protein Cas6/Cse3/CasE [Nocardia sp. NPDC052566]|uniref:type I-E CRISPR-associated protein Cas6/Cse3/CasE n=1 Tax=Nocardia sp. NPDC052566 TaxID=3364330 RepID=UPI0037CC5293
MSGHIPRPARNPPSVRRVVAWIMSVHELGDPGRGGNPAITIATSTFEGTAMIADSARVRAAILTGIGRGRAHGCGLLSLTPTS